MSFPLKSYPCICHVCGKLFSVESRFISAPRTAMIGDETTSRIVQSCGEHTGAEIRAAWLAQTIPRPWKEHA